MKKIIAMLLAVAMVCGLCAVTAAADDVTELTLKVWAPQEDQANADSWLQQMEAKFEEAHPEYKITWINEVCGEDKAKDEVSKDPLPPLMSTCSPTTSWATCWPARASPVWAAPTWSRFRPTTALP